MLGAKLSIADIIEDVFGVATPEQMLGLVGVANLDFEVDYQVGRWQLRELVCLGSWWGWTR